MGPKLPLSSKDVRSIRIRLKADRATRNLALFNLAIDGSLGASEVVQLRVRDVAREGRVLSQGTIKRLAPQVRSQFEITAEARASVAAWIAHKKLKPDQYLFPTRLRESPHLSIRQYAKLVASWVKSIGLNPRAYGTESLRRTKPVQIYRETKNLRAAQLHLGHTKPSNTARFLGIKV